MIKPDVFQNIFTGLLAAADRENATAASALHSLPEVEEAREALEQGLLKEFYYALLYPISNAIDGIIAQQLPESKDAQFLAKHYSFVEGHFNSLIVQYEGSACSSDKSRTIVSRIFKFLKDGQEIYFDRTQQYTYHFPTKIFTTHAEILEMFNALRRLYSGQGTPFVQALLTVVRAAESAKSTPTTVAVRLEAPTSEEPSVNSPVAATSSPQSPFMLERVSLTGADDQTSIDELCEISDTYPFAEWGILYVANGSGTPRNPSQSWREAFFATGDNVRKAVHLCFSDAFHQVLDRSLPKEILRADRMQLNINARKKEFTDRQVIEVYERALDIAPVIILQWHHDTMEPILEFLKSVRTEDRNRVQILLDESRGQGKMPAFWSVDDALEGYDIGLAGGFNEVNIRSTLVRLPALPSVRWVDMETGIRTNNMLDRKKVISVLQTASKFIG